MQSDFGRRDASKCSEIRIDLSQCVGGQPQYFAIAARDAELSMISPAK